MTRMRGILRLHKLDLLKQTWNFQKSLTFSIVSMKDTFRVHFRKGIKFCKFFPFCPFGRNHLLVFFTFFFFFFKWPRWLIYSFFSPSSSSFLYGEHSNILQSILSSKKIWRGPALERHRPPTVCITWTCADMFTEPGTAFSDFIYFLFMFI